jgi:hypothetical protein
MKYNVIVEADINDPPKSHEFLVAKIMTNYFKSDVVFVRPANYRTPDFEINSVKWELKSPMGSSARTIDNNLRAARKQSVNIILDLSRIKLHKTRALSRVHHYLASGPHGFKRLIVITKDGSVIEILP